MFITLEGIEGAGKTSQVENIVAFFKTRGYDCVTTREPGGTSIGTQIRGILLDPANADLDGRSGAAYPVFYSTAFGRRSCGAV